MNFSSVARSLEGKSRSVKSSGITWFILPSIFTVFFIILSVLFTLGIGFDAKPGTNIFKYIYDFLKNGEYKEGSNLPIVIIVYLSLTAALLFIILFTGWIITIVVLANIVGLKEMLRKITTLPILSLDTQNKAKSALSNAGASAVLLGLGIIIGPLAFIGIILALVSASKSKQVANDILWQLQVNQLAQTTNNPTHF
ncbi:hypothetical protein [Metamycoplasma neophronis]|uniref:Uncharacterized protein n=1 Tax=Metamycoplasma neophronis TaxID=872983 RepID=A0ABY2YZG2_9BACT|nr:hypothetical protein [Metamycoplasma neophronis]TPR53527.1 hypothetical protein FJR74_02410 [Metamycoplasma neophronis]